MFRRAFCHVVTVLSVLAVGASAASACTPEEAATVVATIEANERHAQQVATTSQPCCTEAQARYLDAVMWQQAEAEYVAGIVARFASHPLRPIAGCESSWSHTPEGEPVWDRPTELDSTASGGLQMLDGTFRDWIAAYFPEHRGKWSRAMYAPAHLQMELGMRAHQRLGTRPWNASFYCWG